MSFILAMLVLFQSMSFTMQQIDHLDELIEHAQFHKAEYGDNFFVFLSKHYGELKEQHENDQQHEGEDHEQLPFNCQNQLLSSIVFFDFKSSDFERDTEFNLRNEAQFFYLSPVSNFLKKGLLQPPRFA